MEQGPRKLHENLFSLWQKAKRQEHHYWDFLELVNSHATDRASKEVNAEQARDIGQEVAIKLHQSRDSLRFESQAEIVSWIRTTVQRMVADYYRKEVGRKSLEKKFIKSTAVEWSSQPSPEDKAISNQMEEIVRKAISVLHPHLRDIIHLKYFQGMTLSEIAAELGIPEGTVKSRYHNALKSLRPGIKLALGIKEKDE